MDDQEDAGEVVMVLGGMVLSSSDGLVEGVIVSCLGWSISLDGVSCIL